MTQTRELVYAATLEVIAEVGAAGVSVERIADKSGVARSTIYRRWPDQSQLYLEAFAKLARRTSAARTGDTVHDLEHYLEESAARLNDQQYIAVLIALLDRAARDTEFAKLYRQIFDERHSRAAAIVRAGMRAGMLKDATNVREAVVALLSPFTYMSIVRHEKIRAPHIRRVLHDFIEHFGTSRAMDEFVGSSVSQNGPGRAAAPEASLRLDDQPK